MPWNSPWNLHWDWPGLKGSCFVMSVSDWQIIKSLLIKNMLSKRKDWQIRWLILYVRTCSRSMEAHEGQGAVKYSRVAHLAHLPWFQLNHQGASIYPHKHNTDTLSKTDHRTKLPKLATRAAWRFHRTKLHKSPRDKSKRHFTLSLTSNLNTSELRETTNYPLRH